MFLIVLILSVFVFLKTLGYAIFEYKEMSNKVAGYTIVILAICALIFPCILTVL